jgi:hypothetical protein
MKKELTWFQQHFETGDVTYNVRHSQEGRQPHGFDYSIRESELQRIAESRGKMTWDESDILANHATVHAEIVTRAPLLVAPVVTPEPEPAPEE